MAYRIKLTPSEPVRVILEGRDAFRVRIVASDGENMPNEIFLFQRTLVDALTERECDEFMCVCSAFDISIYPANEPSTTQSPAFFRKDTIDILLPSVTLVDEVIEAVEAQVGVLVQVLGQLDNLNEQEATWIPSPPPDESV